MGTLSTQYRVDCSQAQHPYKKKQSVLDLPHRDEPPLPTCYTAVSKHHALSKFARYTSLLKAFARYCCSDSRSQWSSNPPQKRTSRPLRYLSSLPGFAVDYAHVTPAHLSASRFCDDYTNAIPAQSSTLRLCATQLALHTFPITTLIAPSAQHSLLTCSRKDSSM